MVLHYEPGFTDEVCDIQVSRTSVLSPLALSVPLSLSVSYKALLDFLMITVFGSSIGVSIQIIYIK